MIQATVKIWFTSVRVEAQVFYHVACFFVGTCARSRLLIFAGETQSLGMLVEVWNNVCHHEDAGELDFQSLEEPA